jgi:hypothetical protein
MDMSSADISSIASQKPRSRSRVGNRGRVGNRHAALPDVDGRGVIARRFKDIAGAILADQAGADQCSEARKQLIRRFAAAAVLAEQLESRLANGEQINIQEHATLSSVLVRLAQRIGIDRVPRTVTPSLSSYLESIEDTAADEAEARVDRSGHQDAANGE